MISSIFFPFCLGYFLFLSGPPSLPFSLVWWLCGVEWGIVINCLLLRRFGSLVGIGVVRGLGGIRFISDISFSLVVSRV